MRSLTAWAAEHPVVRGAEGGCVSGCLLLCRAVPVLAVLLLWQLVLSWFVVLKVLVLVY